MIALTLQSPRDLPSFKALYFHPYEPRRPLLTHFQGDPHFDTLDGVGYSYQGFGEFIWATSTSPALSLQVRLQPCSGSASVTCPVAIAFNLGGTDYTIKSENGLAGYEPKLLRSSDGSTVTIPLTTGSESVKALTGLTGLEVNLAVGLTIEVQSVSERLFVLARPTVLPSGWIDLQTKIKGLIGYYDNSRSNDYTLRNGTVLTYPPTDRMIDEQFGESWRITAGESKFYYANGESHERMNNVSAWSPFLWDEADVVLPAFVREACAGTQDQDRSIAKC